MLILRSVYVYSITLAKAILKLLQNDPLYSPPLEICVAACTGRSFLICSVSGTLEPYSSLTREKAWSILGAILGFRRQARVTFGCVSPFCFSGDFWLSALFMFFHIEHRRDRIPDKAHVPLRLPNNSTYYLPLY